MQKNLFIIVPCYNGGNYVNDCLDSIQAFIKLNNNLHIHCLFIDDGSEDDTKNKVNFYINNKIINLTYLFKNNGGLCSARNFGLNYISENFYGLQNYVLLLDVDDYIKPINVNLQENYQNHVYDYYIEDRLYLTKKQDINKLSQYNPFVVSCIIFKYDILRFDEELTSLEDWDFWINRFLKEKQSFYFYSESITKIKKTEGSMSTNLNRMHMNRVLVSSKYIDSGIIDRTHIRNFKINQMFQSFTYKKLIKAFIIIFPFIYRRNFLSLLKNTILKRSKN